MVTLKLTSGVVPILAVIVSVVLEIIVNVVPEAGSVDLGYP